MLSNIILFISTVDFRFHRSQPARSFAYLLVVFCMCEIWQIFSLLVEANNTIFQNTTHVHATFSRRIFVVWNFNYPEKKEQKQKYTKLSCRRKSQQFFCISTEFRCGKNSIGMQWAFGHPVLQKYWNTEYRIIHQIESTNYPECIMLPICLCLLHCQRSVHAVFLEYGICSTLSSHSYTYTLAHSPWYAHFKQCNQRKREREKNIHFIDFAVHMTGCSDFEHTHASS